MKGLLVMLVFYCLLLALHALFFKTVQRSWIQALNCWQGLHVVWFLLVMAMMERAHRWRWLQKLARRS